MTGRPGAGWRDPLPSIVELRRFDVWQAALAVVALCALAALAGWAVSVTETRPAPAIVAFALGGLAMIVLALTLARVEAGTLRHQGGQWNFAPLLPAGREPEAGELEVALDFGSFMLLSFLPSGPGRRWSRRWLPAQRLGLEAEWHGLRCAVHAPRPAATTRGDGRAAGALPQ